MVDKKLEIKKVNIEEFVPANYNPRKISEHDYDKLKNSINEFGVVDPIIVNLHDNTIIGGHQRFDVLYYNNNVSDLYLLELGDIGWIFPETDLKIKDKNHEKALNLALNRIHGEWDMDKLDEVLIELEDLKLDELTGFDLEFDDISYDFISREDDEYDDDEEYDDGTDDEIFIEDEYEEPVIDTTHKVKEQTRNEEPVIPRVRKGFLKEKDIYKIGNNYIMYGDSNNEQDRTRLLNLKSLDAQLNLSDKFEKINSSKQVTNYYMCDDAEVLERNIIKYKDIAKKIT